MATVQDDADHWDNQREDPASANAERTRATLDRGPSGRPVFAWVVFALARLWVVCLLLVAAAVAGISVYEYAQSQQELSQVRESPGEQSYAVVAYRRELARQIEEMEVNEADYIESGTLPLPPERPRLLVEIDNLRERNASASRSARAARAADTARPRRSDPRVPD
jgi:hypothetical protein